MIYAKKLRRRRKTKKIQRKRRVGEELYRVVDLNLLSLLGPRPMHAYELIKNMRGLPNYRPSYGTIQPHLQVYERQGLVSSHRRKSPKNNLEERVYSLTEKGRTTVMENLDSLSKLVSKMRRRVALNPVPKRKNALALG